MPNDLEIRPARPSDLDDITNIHVSAFSVEHNLSARLGRRFIRKSNEFFLVDGSADSFVAVADGKVVGYMLGYTGPYTQRYNRYRAFSGALAVLTHPWILLHPKVIRRLLWEVVSHGPAPLRKLGGRLVPPGAPPRIVYTPPQGPKGSVASIAVHPGYSRRACAAKGLPALNVSDRLLAATEEHYRRHGVVAVMAAVVEDNMPSRRAFERNGYREATVLDDQKLYLYCLPLKEHETGSRPSE